MDARSRIDWAGYEPGSIPTKADLSPLEDWLERFPNPARTRILDLGCGTGAIGTGLARRGFAATGVDLNAAAIAAANALGSGARFLVGDVASEKGLDPSLGAFDGVLCQLLLSVVGDPTDRSRALGNAHSVLVPKGRLFASFSGRSEDLNPEYGRLYREDLPATGEDGTYLSRDVAGRVLYRTHHFREDEIRHLLEEAGFTDIDILEKVESSSRRPDQKARFFYATASKC